MLIVALGVISRWYTNSIQDQLLSNNIETTKLVEITASLERSLYQSLIFITAIKEANKTSTDATTLKEPTQGMLTTQFNNELVLVNNSMERVRLVLSRIETSESNKNSEILAELDEKVGFFTSLASDWIPLALENSEHANELFNTAISPYFRNNLIPVINELREQVVEKQNKESNELTKSLEQANYVIAVFSLISVVLSIFIAIYVYRSIAKPLQELNESALKLGEGDLEERIEIKSNDELGELGKAFNEMASNLQKRTLARDYLDNIIETIRETLIVTDEHGIIVGINKAGLDMLHFKKDEIIGLPAQNFYDMEAMGATYNDKRKENSVFEFSFITKRGRRIPVLFSEADLVNADGKKVGSVSVGTDISERKIAAEKMKESLKEKEVLLSEIHHRVKNNLAVISGILHLQGLESKNEEVVKAIKDSQARIQSISLVHEMLYHSDTLSFIDYRTYVNDLLQAITSMHINDEVNIIVKSDIENISLDINQAIPCSLLLNEIVVNSYKHAFEGRKEGRITIFMKKEGNMIQLVIEDDGIGINTDEILRTESLGTTLINTLTSQLGGEYKMDNKLNGLGTRIEIIFPKGK